MHMHVHLIYATTHGVCALCSQSCSEGSDDSHAVVYIAGAHSHSGKAARHTSNRNAAQTMCLVDAQQCTCTDMHMLIIARRGEWKAGTDALLLGGEHKYTAICQPNGNKSRARDVCHGNAR